MKYARIKIASYSVFSCYPLCKGVRCARLCTLFSSRCFLTCLKCITFSCDCQVGIFLTLQGRLVLRYFFQLVYILSHVCVFVNRSFRTFLCVRMSF
nr:MAG TPA: hypothetical protein [Bacteriophage sp.]